MRRLLVLFAVVLLIAACAPKEPIPEPAPPMQAAPAVPNTGTAVLAITDKAFNLAGIKRIDITIDDVELEGPAGPVIFDIGKTYDLLALKETGVEMLLAQQEIAPGTYDKFRMSVSSVRVDGVETFLPSGVLRLVGRFEVVAGQTSYAIFDFLADRSLHQTGTGRLIMAPVIKLTTLKNAEVAVDDGRVRVTSGETVEDAEFGMDFLGEMGKGKKISPTADLDIVDGTLRELVLPVVPGPSMIKEFVMEADDRGFYPDSQLLVIKGDRVRITFKVRTTYVYFGGLDFRSEKFTTEKVPPGGETSVEFVADKSFMFTSYWPNTGTRKADGQVIVQG